MGLPDFSIRRPITTLMIYIGVFLFGIISLGLLSEELFPPITYPQLSIITPYENAAPEEIETLITKPIEEAVGSISGLRKVSSTSKEGLSLVVVEFGWNQNMDFASLSVREKIDLIKERLPRDSSEPVVIKFNPFELPVMTFSIASSERTPVQLRELAKKWFKDELEKIHGVASTSISGGAEEQILLNVDQAKLRMAGVGINEVSDAIAQANLNYPGGTIKESFYEYLVRTLGEFKHMDEIGQVPIRSENDAGARAARYGQPDQPSNRVIYLKDVASITRTTKERTSFSRYNFIDNVTVSVQKQAQSNTVQTANAIRKKLSELKDQLPKDIHIDIIYDQSKFIQEALDGVKDAAVQGGILAFIVLLIFLKDAKNSALVVIITPITVLATFTLMYFMHISLNVISLGGVALGVGMLLDAAVVVIENVHRRYNENPAMGIEKAAVMGANEVVAPMVSSTFTSIAVFLPMIFVTGIAGQIFKDLAWVVVVTHLISAVIAFSLLPMLIVKIGGEPKKEGEEDRFQKFLGRCYAPIQFIQDRYEKSLPNFLDRKGFYLTGVFVIFIASLWLLVSLDRVLLPRIDQGQFMMKVDLPVGSRVEFSNEISKRIENFLKQIPEVASLSAVVGSSKGDPTKEILERLGSHQAQIVVTLRKNRKRTTNEIVRAVREYFDQSVGRAMIRPARLSYVLYESAFKVGGENEAPIVIDIKGPGLDELKVLTLETQAKIEKVPGIYGVTNSIAEPFPETKIKIDKDRASFYRLSTLSIAQAANIAIKGIVASKLKEEGREIDIRVQLNERDRDKLNKLDVISIHSPLGVEVPLADFVHFQKGKGPSEIKRISQERTTQVYAKVYERSLKEVTQEIQSTLDHMRVPKHYSVKIAGESEEIQESFTSLQFAFSLSIILVYMIMAAQFESLWKPFLIMFCVPLALVGVALALWGSHTPVSVVAILGIILLAGIVVNNGIILIDFVNHLLGQGKSLREAIIQAGKIRLRPILMTALASTIGLVPLALGIGAGAELQAPMAITVIGGLLVATFLTLVVIPALYTATDEFASKLRRPK